MQDEQNKFDIAREYVDKQLETMKRYGSAPKDISEQEYRALVAEVAENMGSDRTVEISRSAGAGSI